MSTLSFYWELASLDPETRLKAAEQLNETLSNFQKEHQLNNKNKFDAGLSKYEQSLKLEQDLLAEDVSYAVKRLIRGLPSSRDGARQGFTLALTELLHNLAFLRVKTILDLIDQFTEITGSMKAQEEKEMYFGKLFGYIAILESGMLSRKETRAEDISKFTMNLLAFSKAKSYLNQVCIGTLIKLLESSSHKEIVQEILKKELESSEWNAGTVLIALNIEHPLKSNPVLAAENKTLIANWLLNSTENHPNIHPVWDLIIGKLSTATGVMSIEEFWSSCVENNLFHSSHERKYLGFQIFLKLISSSEKVEFLFSVKMVRTLINSLSSENNFLYKAALNVIKNVALECKKNNQLALLMTCNVFSMCPPNVVEKLRKQQLISQIQECLDTLGMNSYVDQLISALETDNLLQQKALAETMCALIRNQKLAKSTEITEKVLQVLINYAFSDSEFGKFCQEKLCSSINDLLRSNKSEWAKFAVDQIQKLPNDKSDESKQALKLVKKLQKIKDEKMKSFEVLVHHTLLVAYIDETMWPILQDINECFDQMFQKTSQELNPFDVLLDILLNFLSRQSSLLRTVAEKTFTAFCHGITEKGIELITDVLDKESQLEQDEVSDEEMSDFEQVSFDSTEEATLVEESSDEDLDDEQMAAFDEKLAQVFKEQKKIKQAKKTVKDQSMHFKAKVVDLLDIYLKNEPCNPLVFKFIVPCLSVLSSCPKHEQVVFDKLTSVLMNHFKKPADFTDLQDILKVLEECLAFVVKGGQKTFINCTLHLTRFTCASLMNPSNEPPKKKRVDFKASIVEQYKNSLDAMCSRKKAVFVPELFVDLCKTSIELGSLVAIELAKNSNLEKMGKLFKVQASLQCIFIILKLKTASEHPSVSQIIVALCDNVPQIFSETLEKQKAKDLLKIYAGILRLVQKQNVDASALKTLVETQLKRFEFSNINI